MGLQEQKVTFKFAGGVNTKPDEKAVPATELLTLENAVFTKAISLKKRNGYEAYSRDIDGSVSLVTAPRRLAVRDNELIQFTDNRAYGKQVADQWSDLGTVICATARDRALVHTGSSQTVPDYATNNGVTVAAWEDSRGGVWWTTRNAETGAVYRAPVQARANGQRPRCVPVGELLHVYIAEPFTHAVYVLVINPAQPSANVTATLLIDDLDNITGGNFDACATTRPGTPAVIAWQEYASARLRVGYVDVSGVIGSPVTGHPSAVTVSGAPLSVESPITVAYSPNTDLVNEIVMVGAVSVHPVNGTNDGSLFEFEGDLTELGRIFAYPNSIEVVRCAVSVGLDGNCFSVWEETASASSEHYVVVVERDINGSAVQSYTIRSLQIASKSFTANADDHFCSFIHSTTYFNTYLVHRLDDFSPVGRILPGSAVNTNQSHVPSVHVVDDVARFTVAYKTRLGNAAGDAFTESGLRLIELDFDDDDSHQTTQIGRGLYLAGGCPLHYDGLTWNEYGFHYGPEHITAVPGSGGALTPATTYQYLAWYEWTDAQGEIHRGPTSIPILAVLTTENKVTLTIPTYRVTKKQNVRVCVARSLAGDATRMFRITALDPTTTGANGYLANDTTVDSLTLVDGIPDTALANREPIYTTGGILSNDAVALGPILAASKNRIFFTDSSVGNYVRFSQQIAEGYALEIAPELRHEVPAEGGDITALAVMDDVVYAFKASAIFAFNGDGPLPNGSTAVGGFSSAIKVPGSVGCSEPSSIVEIPQGLMFKSDKGIWLLDRARNVQYVGARVERYNSQTIRRATAMPGRSQVVFLTDSGKSLLFDHLFSQWSTFTNHEGYDSAIVDNTYHYLRTDARIFRETLDEYSDAGVRIPLVLETAWIHLHDHLQGWQRFWDLLLLGSWKSPHQLGVSYQIDYSDSWAGDPWWYDATNASSSTGWLTGDNCAPIGEELIGGSAYGSGPYGYGPYGGTNAGIYQWRYGLSENAQSIRFRFEDFEKSGIAGASFELTEMTITGGIMKPSARPFTKARGA